MLKAIISIQNLSAKYLSNIVITLFALFQVGVELAPLLKTAGTGKPHKDPVTGYVMGNSLSSTDVTRAQVPGNTHR